jgi:hypothetical protein
VNRAPAPPRAPWGSFPLSELTVLLAVALGIYGVASWGSSRAVWAIGGATVLGCLAGLEVAVREHFAGYRSHASLLAGAVAALAAAGAFALRAPVGVVFAVAIGTFLVGVALLVRAFERARARV